MSEVRWAVAGPQKFGQWKIIASQINGPMAYEISAVSIGNALVFGEVSYWDERGVRRVEPFQDFIRIVTGNSTQNVRVRFKSAGPFTTEVRVIVATPFRPSRAPAEPLGTGTATDRKSAAGQRRADSVNQRALPSLLDLL